MRSTRLDAARWLLWAALSTVPGCGVWVSASSVPVVSATDTDTAPDSATTTDTSEDSDVDCPRLVTSSPRDTTVWRQGLVELEFSEPMSADQLSFSVSAGGEPDGGRTLRSVLSTAGDTVHVFRPDGRGWLTPSALDATATTVETSVEVDWGCATETLEFSVSDVGEGSDVVVQDNAVFLGAFASSSRLVPLTSALAPVDFESDFIVVFPEEWESSTTPTFLFGTLGHDEAIEDCQSRELLSATNTTSSEATISTRLPNQIVRVRGRQLALDAIDVEAAFSGTFMNGNAGAMLGAVTLSIPVLDLLWLTEEAEEPDLAVEQLCAQEWCGVCTSSNQTCVRVVLEGAPLELSAVSPFGSYDACLVEPTTCASECSMRGL